MLRPVLPMDNPASLLAALQHRLYHQTPNRRGLAGFFVKSLAVLLAVIRDLAFGQLTLRATSLVYTTLLSIVPMLALTFSVSTAFGVRGQIEPALARFMEPLGPRGQEITTNIMNFINNMNVGVLGSVGLGMLLFTAVSTILKIEASINTIWHVKQMRSISQRISGYLCILLLGPILVFSARAICRRRCGRVCFRCPRGRWRRLRRLVCRAGRCSVLWYCRRLGRCRCRRLGRMCCF